MSSFTITDENELDKVAKFICEHHLHNKIFLFLVSSTLSLTFQSFLNDLKFSCAVKLYVKRIKKNKLILIKVLLTYRLLKFHQLLTYCLLQHISLKLAQCQMGESLAKYFHQNNICNHQFFLVL